ncbi:MAG: bifunctional nicotinamidase/pyrazinamidase [Desulfobacula sp.]|uniref:bifunctional nicotinamidase/pyrazinamidase n=1 Tax=Desulfobacula sp. TaxID=2593537 RepID=UPI0025C1AC51|nr:bifunctional nicotinamidase/pyrazinamidase [Desulfobacula sp.]MCD4721387.1 bifunctional nicotinamidase/pyrazinamidase [Desulfobacula sp.]
MTIPLDRNQTGVIVVDIQGDFTLFKHGSLAVQQTDQSYIDKVVAATKQLKSKGHKIFATQDFHPENHISFYTSHKDKTPYETIEIDGRSQILWPPHCVQGTENADILIDNTLFTAIIQKGMNPKYDSYSGFFDDNGIKTGLDNILKSHQVDTLIVYGLATDYCVKATAMDAVKSGYGVFLIEELCKGVSEDTTESALKEMISAGIKIKIFDQVFERNKKRNQTVK